MSTSAATAIGGAEQATFDMTTSELDALREPLCVIERATRTRITVTATAPNGAITSDTIWRVKVEDLSGTEAAALDGAGAYIPVRACMERLKAPAAKEKEFLAEGVDYEGDEGRRLRQQAAAIDRTMHVMGLRCNTIDHTSLEGESGEAKQLIDLYNEVQIKAANAILAHNGFDIACNPTSVTKIDLHGLRVVEAKAIIANILLDLRAKRNPTTLTIITGQGTHSLRGGESLWDAALSVVMADLKATIVDGSDWHVNDGIMKVRVTGRVRSGATVIEKIKRRRLQCWFAGDLREMLLSLGKKPAVTECTLDSKRDGDDDDDDAEDVSTPQGV